MRFSHRRDRQCNPWVEQQREADRDGEAGQPEIREHDSNCGFVSVDKDVGVGVNERLRAGAADWIVGHDCAQTLRGNARCFPLKFFAGAKR
jgi:hypothetical protein